MTFFANALDEVERHERTQSELSRLMAYVREKFNMANRYAWKQAFCAQRFASLDSPNM